jgi:hypothetical protein
VRFYQAMWIYYRKWGRHRRNPLVLAPLAAALVGLAATAIVSNTVRARRRGPDPSRAR